jgi:hypothetical protein
MLQRISDLCSTIKSLTLGQASSGPSAARDRRERLGQFVQKVEANVVDPGSVSRQHITPILLPSGDGGGKSVSLFNPVNTGTAKRSRAVWLGHARKLIYLSAHPVSSSLSRRRVLLNSKFGSMPGGRGIGIMRPRGPADRNSAGSAADRRPGEDNPD